MKYAIMVKKQSQSRIAGCVYLKDGAWSYLPIRWPNEPKLWDSRSAVRAAICHLDNPSRFEIVRADQLMSVSCPNCSSNLIESQGSREIETGNGTPVRAISFECHDCGWKFIHNEVIGRAPDQPVGDA